MTATIVRLADRRRPGPARPHAAAEAAAQAWLWHAEAERLQRSLDDLHRDYARLLRAVALANASAARVTLLLATLALAGWGVALWR